MKELHLFTSESVTEGHPDKVCDQISDAILDEFLTKDPQSRVAAETLATTGMVLVSGEITSNCYVDIPQIVRNTVRNIGYEGIQGGGFDCDTCSVLTSMTIPSPHQCPSQAEESRLGSLLKKKKKLLTGFQWVQPFIIES